MGAFSTEFLGVEIQCCKFSAVVYTASKLEEKKSLISQPIHIYRLFFFRIIAFITGLLAFACVSSTKIPLTIGGVFDIDTQESDDNSANMIPIVRMAIKDVNACPKTLTDYELQMDVKDVKARKFKQI